MQVPMSGVRYEEEGQDRQFVAGAAKQVAHELSQSKNYFINITRLLNTYLCIDKLRRSKKYQ